MYNGYYGFREFPFNQTPDTEYFFPSEGHQAALNALIYAIQQRRGFALLTGDIGCGKTTVIRTIMRRLDSNVKVALLLNTRLSPKGVIHMLLEDLGYSFETGSKDKLLIQLQKVLLEEAEKDKNILLLVDEAQNLSPSCLEEIRMLSNLETEKEKLIQIVLVGQPELREKLQLQSLEQLRQRILIHYHLNPLDEANTKRYILHRLNIAKSNGQDLDSLFDEEAFRLVYQHTQGIPRLVNSVCDYALLAGYVSGKKNISETDIHEAVEAVLKFEVTRKR